MGFFRVLLVALFGVFALIAGLITAAAVTLGTAVIVFIRRALRQPAQSGNAQLPRRPVRRVVPPRGGDVIDISATEVPADSPQR